MDHGNDRLSTPRGILLDVTRTCRRGDRVPTGIDRVERAYLDWVLDQPGAVFGLLRTRLGYLLLDRDGLRHVRANPGIAEARHVARHRAPPFALARMLGRLPGDTVYFNVGHSNLTARVVDALRRAGLGPLVALVHDTIPVDWADTQHPETKARFEVFLGQVQRCDHILTPSVASAHDVQRHIGHRPVHAAPLGVEAPTAGRIVEALRTKNFVLMLGTIEPRKNHDLLLGLWEAAPADSLPMLAICGARGWAGPEILRRLDLAPNRVLELGALPDDQRAWLLQNARALVFPSLAEGYGLPPLEAAVCGTPVLCSDLPVLRETLGDRAVFLPPNDPEAWRQALMHLPARQTPMPRPGWEDHFKIVLNLI